MFTDPVCGMEVHESTAPANTFYEGTVYYFCSRTCLGAFQDNPNNYVDEVAQRLLQHLAYPYPTL
jgi:YHS domain-containing protein